MLRSALILDLPAGRTAGGELRRDPQQGSLQRLVGAISDEEDSRVSRPAHRQRRETPDAEVSGLLQVLPEGSSRAGAVEVLAEPGGIEAARCGGGQLVSYQIGRAHVCTPVTNA